MKLKFVALMLASLAVVAHAQTPATDTQPAKAPTVQNNRMSECSAEFKATGKDGKERQAFMKTCLSAKSADGKKAQNHKMTQCSADFKATGKPGAERKAFMSTCLKG